MILIHFKCLEANLRGRKGAISMVSPGRHFAALRHSFWLSPQKSKR